MALKHRTGDPPTYTNGGRQDVGRYFLESEEPFSARIVDGAAYNYANPITAELFARNYPTTADLLSARGITASSVDCWSAVTTAGAYDATVIRPFEPVSRCAIDVYSASAYNTGAIRGLTDSLSYGTATFVQPIDTFVSAIALQDVINGITDVIL